MGTVADPLCPPGACPKPPDSGQSPEGWDIAATVRSAVDAAVKAVMGPIMLKIEQKLDPMGWAMRIFLLIFLTLFGRPVYQFALTLGLWIHRFNFFTTTPEGFTVGNPVVQHLFGVMQDTALAGLGIVICWGAISVMTRHFTGWHYYDGLELLGRTLLGALLIGASFQFCAGSIAVANAATAEISGDHLLPGFDMVSAAGSDIGKVAGCTISGGSGPASRPPGALPPGPPSKPAPSGHPPRPHSGAVAPESAGLEGDRFQAPPVPAVSPTPTPSEGSDSFCKSDKSAQAGLSDVLQGKSVGRIFADLFAICFWSLACLLLLFGMLLRLCLLDCFIVLSPLAMLCWILPTTSKWTEWWVTNFIGLLVVHFVQNVVLSIGAGFIASAGAVGDAAGFGDIGGLIMQIVLGTGCFFCALKVPSLLGGMGGSGMSTLARVNSAAFGATISAAQSAVALFAMAGIGPVGGAVTGKGLAGAGGVWAIGGPASAAGVKSSPVTPVGVPPGRPGQGPSPAGPLKTPPRPLAGSPFGSGRVIELEATQQNGSTLSESDAPLARRASPPAAGIQAGLPTPKAPFAFPAPSQEGAALAGSAHELAESARSSGARIARVEGTPGAGASSQGSRAAMALTGAGSKPGGPVVAHLAGGPGYRMTYPVATSRGGAQLRAVTSPGTLVNRLSGARVPSGPVPGGSRAIVQAETSGRGQEYRQSGASASPSGAQALAAKPDGAGRPLSVPAPRSMVSLSGSVGTANHSPAPAHTAPRSAPRASARPARASTAEKTERLTESVRPLVIHSSPAPGAGESRPAPTVTRPGTTGTASTPSSTGYRQRVGEGEARSQYEGMSGQRERQAQARQAPDDRSHSPGERQWRTERNWEQQGGQQQERPEFSRERIAEMAGQAELYRAQQRQRALRKAMVRLIADPLGNALKEAIRE